MPRESYELQAAALKKLIAASDLKPPERKRLENAARNLESLAELRRTILRGEIDPDVVADKLIRLLHLPHEDVVKA